MPKVLSYEDKAYNPKKDIYHVLEQVLQDMKTDRYSYHGWNRPTEQVSGITMRLAGPENIELIYHRTKTGTLEYLLKTEDDGCDFLNEVEKEFKKRFKKMTGKTLKLKKVNEDQSVEKQSQIQNRAGTRPIGRYLVRDRRVYEFTCNLE